MKKTFVLPECTLEKEQYLARKDYFLESGKALKDSITSFNLGLTTCLATTLTSPFANITMVDSYDRKSSFSIPSAHAPSWANRQFGAVNTVENSACIAFVSKIMLEYFGFSYKLEDILSELETKGYRLWKFANNSRTLSTPNFDVDSIKKEFPSDDPIQDCKNVEEIKQLYGEPVGIGGAACALDNIIHYLAKQPSNTFNTRITDFKKIIENLKMGIPVPIRVENSIYHNDNSRKGGHYVVLFGLIEGKAYVLDTSVKNGIKTISAQRLFKAMLATEQLIAAWDFSPCVKEG